MLFHFWHNINSTPDTREIPGCKQCHSTFTHLSGLRESLQQSSKIWQVGNRPMAGASRPVHLQGRLKHGDSWRWVQRGVWCGRGALSREFPTCFPWVLPLYRLPDYHCPLLLNVETWSKLGIEKKPASSHAKRDSGV